ncbi:hypothetical protein R1flu_008785 [Riccia fluitans]|uniref:Uncharacterized protein n=1 Tax=Riccia fluitans TaxID=41844 RepID=A0ABD1XH51_9MARC
MAIQMRRMAMDKAATIRSGQKIFPGHYQLRLYFCTTDGKFQDVNAEITEVVASKDIRCPGRVHAVAIQQKILLAPEGGKVDEKYLLFP